MPVRLLGPLFLALVGAAAAEATQVIGALLLLGLLAAPAAAAQHLTDRPWRGLWLSAGLAVTSVWAGVTITYAAPRIPASFAIISVATALYAATSLTARVRVRPPSPPPGMDTVTGPVSPGRTIVPGRLTSAGRSHRAALDPTAEAVGMRQPSRSR